MEIMPGIHRIIGFVNQYLIWDGKEITLIDTGMKSNDKKVIKYLNENNLDLSKIRRILITHSDSDHYGAASSLKSLTGAEIWTSKIEAEAMRTGSSSRPIVPRGFFSLIFPLLKGFLTSPPVMADKLFTEDVTLPISGGLQVISSPGHTPGHISFFLPDKRILFAGDAITLDKGKPAPTVDATTGNPDRARESFNKLMKLNPSVICCGHAYIDLRNQYA